MGSPPDDAAHGASSRAGLAERRSLVGGWPLAIVGMVLALLAYELRYTLIPFVFAAMIGFVLDPVLAWSADRLGGRRWPASVLLTLLIVGAVGLGGYWIGSTAYREASSIADRLPRMIEQAVATIAGPHGIEMFGTHYTPQQASGALLAAGGRVLGGAKILLAVQIGFGAIAGMILTLVLVPYFFVSGPRIAAGTIWLIPPERRRSVEDTLPELVPMLRRYVIGIIGVVIYTAIVAYVGFGLIFRLPGPALLSVVVGCLEMIPVIGPVTSIALVGLASLQQGGLGALLAIAWALALRLSIDNLVGPLLLGRAVTVHPVVVIFAFVIGAMLFGIIGLLLAVPTAACIKVILERYYAEPIERRPG
jgi:predicted PurR-regulated permease PerM